MAETLKNRFRTDRWKEDTVRSVDLYNQWFITSAPAAYRKARSGVMSNVVKAIKDFALLRNMSAEVLASNPQYLSVLRASTAPPLAIDRLGGLSGTSRHLISNLEKGKLPRKCSDKNLQESLTAMLSIIGKLMDYDIFPWLKEMTLPSAQMINRSASIVADRISGALADPIIRNSQETRQIDAISNYLEHRGYNRIPSNDIREIESMPPGSYTFHHNVPVLLNGKKVNMPIDVIIQTQGSAEKGFPFLVECKSAGDFANTNKRRKEEAVKVTQLRQTYGDDKITFILFLCGYFESSYLGYEASENIDWVWEHRISDFSEFGI